MRTSQADIANNLLRIDSSAEADSLASLFLWWSNCSRVRRKRYQRSGKSGVIKNSGAVEFIEYSLYYGGVTTYNMDGMF